MLFLLHVILENQTFMTVLIIRPQHTKSYSEMLSRFSKTSRYGFSYLSIPSCLSVEKRLRETVQFGVESSSAFLECQPRSPQATVKWFFQKDGKRKAVRVQVNTYKQLGNIFLVMKSRCKVQQLT